MVVVVFTLGANPFEAFEIAVCLRGFDDCPSHIPVTGEVGHDAGKERVFVLIHVKSTSALFVMVL